MNTSERAQPLFASTGGSHPLARFTDQQETHGPRVVEQLVRNLCHLKVVVIGENVWVGDNLVIIGPATIGRGAIVSANSIVHGMVPSDTIVAGAPAKPIKIFNSKSGSWDKA